MTLQQKQGHASDVQRAVNPGFEFHVSPTSDRQVYPKIHGHQLFRELSLYAGFHGTHGAELQCGLPARTKVGTSTLPRVLRPTYPRSYLSARTSKCRPTIPGPEDLLPEVAANSWCPESCQTLSREAGN